MTDTPKTGKGFDPTSYFNINLKRDLEGFAAQGLTFSEAFKTLKAQFPKMAITGARDVVKYHGIKFRDPVKVEKISVAIPQPIMQRAVELAGIRQIPLEELFIASVEQVLADHAMAGGA